MIALFKLNVKEINLYGILCAYCSGNNVFVRVIPRLLGSEFSKAHHLCDQGMVLRHLVKRAICCQIQPAVSYVCNVGIVADNRSYYHRRTHAFHGYISFCLLKNLAVCCFNSMPNDPHRVEIRISFYRFHQYRNTVTRSKIARVMASHAVCNDKEVRKVSDRRGGGKHKILVHRPFLSDIGCRKYLHAFFSCIDSRFLRLFV